MPQLATPNQAYKFARVITLLEQEAALKQPLLKYKAREEAHAALRLLLEELGYGPHVAGDLLLAWYRSTYPTPLLCKEWNNLVYTPTCWGPDY